mmetsp:Transcript_5626/g.15170  ORF Transcript_5626/g.15170 Transcript_5626/m.15170 type:complete len:261 (+) Transcript_5626:183-965(+)
MHSGGIALVVEAHPQGQVPQLEVDVCPPARAELAVLEGLPADEGLVGSHCLCEGPPMGNMFLHRGGGCHCHLIVLANRVCRSQQRRHQERSPGLRAERQVVGLEEVVGVDEDVARILVVELHRLEAHQEEHSHVLAGAPAAGIQRHEGHLAAALASRVRAAAAGDLLRNEATDRLCEPVPLRLADVAAHLADRLGAPTAMVDLRVALREYAVAADLGLRQEVREGRLKVLVGGVVAATSAAARFVVRHGYAAARLGTRHS